MGVLGEDTRKCCELDVLCMQEGCGQGLLLRGVEGSIGRFFC